MSWQLIFALVLLMFLIIVGVPVPFCFGAGVMALAVTTGDTTAWMFPLAYSKVNSILLMTIPMFIMAGNIMNSGGIGKALVDWLSDLLCRVKGNLVVVASFACGIFGAVCGSGTATLSCIGSILSPRMHEDKYPPGVIGAILCCSAPLGLLIPPSGIQILVAWSGQMSVLACFLATAVPGVILMCLLALVSKSMLKDNKEIPEAQHPPLKQWVPHMGKTTVGAFPALLMPVIILGGIYGGYTTPTESAAVAVIYAIPVSMLVYKSLTWKQTANALKESAITCGVVTLMVFFISILSRMLIMANLPTIILNAFMAVSDDPKVILLMINLLMIITGMVMDDTSGTLLLTPILLPVVKAIGVSPYQFAAILGVNLGLGNITPPCAPFLYMASRVCKCDTASMIKPVAKLILFAYLPTLLLTTFIPEVSLWLPRLILGDKFIG